MQWLSRLFAPYLDWIQVEITSHCNASCVYCPNAAFREHWESIHMPMDLYQRLSRAFPRTCLVYLQGWGEPLLHPHFFDMIQIARGHGYRVGTTTNGVLLGEETAERVVQEGMDIVGFSLAGTDESQNRIRRGAPLASVLLAIQRLQEAKRKHNAQHPDIHVAYMWLRSQREAVRQLPALLEGRGVRQAVVSTLDLVPRAGVSNEVIQAHNAEEDALLRSLMLEVVEDGQKRGVEIVFHLLSPFTTPGMCTENVTRALFVSSRGLVSPCALTNLPLLERHGRQPAEPGTRSSLIFGDIHELSLAEIWRTKPYKAFRQDHARARSPLACGSCLKLRAE